MSYVVLTPEFQLRLTQANTDNFVEMNKIIASDPERNFSGNVCANGGQECAGDVRFYDWADAGMGSSRRSCSPRATARPSPAGCGPRARAPRSAR